MRPFVPIIRNPHVLTILSNFWPRGYDFTPFLSQRRLIQTDPDTQVLVITEQPVGVPVGEVVLLHGLEGSGDAGYIRSMAWQALNAGFITHRFHMRTCGGTGHLCKTLYHAGLTSDLRAFLRELRKNGSELPIWLIGFSLGGNVSLKLAGEEGETGLVQGVCAISTPIDLAACARRIGQPDNALYEKRFLKRMKERLLATGRYTKADLAGCDTLWQIDDRVTAPSFGFGNAANYYKTQSAYNFLDAIRVPAVLIQAKDDTFIPFEIFGHPAIAANPFLKLLATEHGGHLGFTHERHPGSGLISPRWILFAPICELPPKWAVIASVKLEFASIVADNQSMVFSVALRFLRNREVAEELAQDVFLQCFRHLDRIEGEAHATSWLRRAICHRAIDELRKRRFRPAVGLDDIPEPAASGPMPDLLLSERLREMVGALPEKARMVVVLRYQEDMDPMEIAEILEMPVSTVKSHLHRSLALLRGRLTKTLPVRRGESGVVSEVGAREVYP